MNQTIIDTRQKAEELLAEAIAIWRKSNHADQLEGLENDPVFSLLMSAVAYQANETENEMQLLKNDVLEEYASLLLPYDEAHPVPATACISVTPSSGLPEVELDSSCVFTLQDTDATFIPVLRTRVLPATVASVQRLDGRRWNVRLNFSFPVSDLSGFCFAVKSHSFRDLDITVGGCPLPLVRPWQTSELPFSEIFSLEHSVYNGTHLYDPSVSVMDLCADQDVRLYCVDRHDAGKYIKDEAGTLDLEFTFSGIKPDFCFERTNLSLNTVVLANVKENSVTLDSANPVARVDKSLMYVLRPDQMQMYANEKIRVRRLSADRFDEKSLLRLISTLLTKAQSDYYAFRNLPSKAVSQSIDAISLELEKLKGMASQMRLTDIGGTYIMLVNPHDGASLNLRYLTTDGTSISRNITVRSVFLTSAGLSQAELVGEPVPGQDAGDMNEDALSRIQYSLQTGNRIVTPADIKIFCKKELMTRYGIPSSMIRGVAVKPRLQTPDERLSNASGYVIAVDVDIEDSGFVRRSFEDRLPQAELLMEKMIQVRSTGIYPIKVSIKIN